MAYVPNAIAPVGKTYDLPVTSTGSAHVDVGPCDAVLCFVPAAASAPIWIAVGDVNATARVPVSNTPGTATPVAPGQSLQFSMAGAKTYVAAIAGSGSADLIITPLGSSPA